MGRLVRWFLHIFKKQHEQLSVASMQYWTARYDRERG